MNTRISNYCSTFVYTLCLAVAFCGCSQPNIESKTNYTFQEGAFAIVEIDSCEYILSKVYVGSSICHKGNCKFCAERNKN